jgi:hypothetical protein
MKIVVLMFALLTAITGPALAGPFDRAPDDVSAMLNEIRGEFGFAQSDPASNCKTTKLYRACEFEIDGVLISINGPMGKGPGTSKILVVADSSRPTDKRIAGIAAGIIAIYAPKYRHNATGAFRELAASLHENGNKGVLTADGAYFSLMQVGADVHFHAMPN